jgi:hypothetical protein
MGLTVFDRFVVLPAGLASRMEYFVQKYIGMF